MQGVGVSVVRVFGGAVRNKTPRDGALSSDRCR
jgi:hypothetical protein